MDCYFIYEQILDKEFDPINKESNEPLTDSTSD